MGNRAVIVTDDTTPANQATKLGVYVHWYGSEDDIKMFLTEAKRRCIRRFDEDPSYFWARFVQTIADILTAEDVRYYKENGREVGDDVFERGVGIDIVSNLDTDNGDNGVYYINRDFEIVKQTDGSEFNRCMLGNENVLMLN